MYAEPDPRHTFLRPALLDPIRKPLALGMLAGAAFVGAHTLGDRMFADTRGAANVPSFDAPPAVPINLAVQAPPSGGTAIATGYYSAPPYGPVDPNPPSPIIRLDRDGG